MSLNDDRYTRQGQLALAYKLCIKRMCDACEVRYGRMDPVFREAVMVEMATFFHKAKELLDGTDPVHEQFFNQVEDLCQSVRTSQDRTGS